MSQPCSRRGRCQDTGTSCTYLAAGQAVLSGTLPPCASQIKIPKPLDFCLWTKCPRSAQLVFLFRGPIELSILVASQTRLVVFPGAINTS